MGRPNDQFPLLFDCQTIPAYKLIREDDPRCPHIRSIGLPHGESLLAWQLPVPCEACYERFQLMVREEADWLFARCDEEVVWVAELPAEDDPCRDVWHLPVGARLRGGDQAAFVLQTDDTSLVVATAGLWGGAGRMLKAYWYRDLRDTVRSRVGRLLEEQSVTRGEMFYRRRFHEYGRGAYWPDRLGRDPLRGGAGGRSGNGVRDRRGHLG
jgi:hypothetical protein